MIFFCFLSVVLGCSLFAPGPLRSTGSSRTAFRALPEYSRELNFQRLVARIKDPALLDPVETARNLLFRYSGCGRAEVIDALVFRMSCCREFELSLLLKIADFVLRECPGSGEEVRASVLSRLIAHTYKDYRVRRVSTVFNYIWNRKRQGFFETGSDFFFALSNFMLTKRGFFDRFSPCRKARMFKLWSSNLFTDDRFCEGIKEALVKRMEVLFAEGSCFFIEAVNVLEEFFDCGVAEEIRQDVVIKVRREWMRLQHEEAEARHREIARAQDGVEVEDVCSVCLCGADGESGPLNLTICGHLFHDSCLIRAVTPVFVDNPGVGIGITPGNLCPTCKTDVGFYSEQDLLELRREVDPFSGASAIAFRDVLAQITGDDVDIDSGSED